MCVPESGQSWVGTGNYGGATIRGKHWDKAQYYYEYEYEYYDDLFITSSGVSISSTWYYCHISCVYTRSIYCHTSHYGKVLLYDNHDNDDRNNYNIIVVIIITHMLMYNISILLNNDNHDNDNDNNDNNSNNDNNDNQHIILYGKFSDFKFVFAA